MKTHKEQLHVVIFTPQHKIKGEIYLYENSRLSDILNTENISKDFLPITKANVTDLKSGETFYSEFLSVSKKHIEMVLEEPQSK